MPRQKLDPASRMVRINLFLTPQELDALSDYCTRCGLNRADVARRLLDNFLQGEGYVLDRGKQVVRRVPRLEHRPA